MNKPVKSFRFPYILVGVAIVIAVFYRSPQGSGNLTNTTTSTTPAGITNPSSGPFLAPGATPFAFPTSPASQPSVSTAKPAISAPNDLQASGLSKINPPSVRKSVAPDFSATNRVEHARGPAAPDLREEPVYPPDSYPHPLPPTPVAPEGIPPKAVPPLKISIIRHGNESSNQIALTFDDGPNNKFTPEILDILKERNLKGTFFVLGEQVKRYPEVLRRIAQEGHEIGNHTYSHPQLNRLSDEKVRQELVSTQEEIRKVLGFVPKLLRPPYGAYRDSSLVLFEELGLNVVLWSVDTYDWKRKADSIEKIVSKEAKNGSIILFHDRKTETVRVLPQIIDELLGRGLKPVTVSELTGLQPYDYGSPVADLQRKQPVDKMEPEKTR